ncbi:Putative glucosamine-6-phosphate deaminase-like protein BT_0258 [Seminavis robusta]|uniref:Glucosamine-6-phosphate deaminase-like protein BT_0258 n=1 Tax=Seminavis robusta TaxID=568900 RepID=A0A9N8DVY3_9STRA|nr:Putative glucosamine-6-phosphate deaminase-like protein BT_0258 [Seminavis robusta]|eukprot:Sro322_g116940.1 Putative glucosamine-6-phosphate deaminase-like protein BT_0258 (644) ;mRNA; r:10457-12607
MDRETWKKSPLTRKEKVHTQIFANAAQASRLIAEEIAALIRDKADKKQKAVLGLATGSSPLGVYKELIRMHKEEGLSFQNVITFNLDEYYPMQPTSLQSYVRFMKENLFDEIDIPPDNVHIPDGTLPRDKVAEFCAEYERLITDAGGLDLQILGIGRTGHIGFNEPGSPLDSSTRLVTLDYVTRTDAASDFFGQENVPRKAITMGIGAIMKSKRCILMAWGENKARIVQKAIEGELSEQVPATYLQQHPNTLYVLEESASTELSRVQRPWCFVPIDWTSQTTTKKAVIWLAKKLGKAVLKLTDRDYMDNGMSDLILDQDSAYNINIRVFKLLQRTITGWPGGKPNVDDTHRPERKDPAQKRVLIFSPHPDDDVISMGGTFQRLVDQGHEVYTAYQTSGNIAVFDDDVMRFADFVADIRQQEEEKTNGHDTLYHRVVKSIRSKQPGDIDSDEVLNVKALIRKSEARAACRYVGVPDERIHFLNLPFYETGTVKKRPPGEQDFQIVCDLIQQIQPHQIYAAGDLSDPHGTHRVCLQVIFESIDRLKQSGALNQDDCWVWLYRGAWQEYPMDEIDMAVPLSPDEVTGKRRAIFKHQSQKDTALFPGADPREFWQRAEARNAQLAQDYDELGLPEYAAMEAFKRYHY